MLWSHFTRAEEASILSTARVIDSTIDTSICPNPQFLISGNFWIFCASNHADSDKKEFIIDLGKSTTLHTVFINNSRIYSNNSRKFIGTT